MKPGKRTAAILLLLVGLVLVNFLASRVPVRIDATAEKLYTLSDGSKAMLAAIEEPIQLELYFNRSARSLPVYVKNYADRVEEMLRQYVRASRGQITLKVVDPVRDTPEEERAVVMGIRPQAAGGEEYLFGLVAVQAHQEHTIPTLTVQREQFLEFDVSQLIYSVQQLARKKLGVLTTLSILPADDMQARLTGRTSPGQAVSRQWAATFEVENVRPTATVLPPDLDMLAILHPKPINPGMLYAIDQFILSGKPVFIAVDPQSFESKRTITQLARLQGDQDSSSDLPELFSAYGITYDRTKVVADPENSTRIGVGTSVIRSPLWLELSREEINAQSLVTAQLTQSFFIEAGSVGLAPGSIATLTPLIQTSANAGEIAASTVEGRAQPAPESIAAEMTGKGKKTLAAFITGRLKSAFPDGPPVPPAGPEGAAPVEMTPGTPLKESRDISTIFLVADTDWFMDFFGAQRRENLNFAVNVMEYLGGSPELISVRGKQSSLRPFEVVRDIEAAASKEFGEKQAAVEAKLREVQAGLSQLMQRTGENGRTLEPTPEVRKAIDDYRNQQVGLQREAREIRLALRRDVEALENRLLAINLLAAPLLVCVFGIWFQRRRLSARGATPAAPTS